VNSRSLLALRTTATLGGTVEYVAEHIVSTDHGRRRRDVKAALNRLGLHDWCHDFRIELVLDAVRERADTEEPADA